jgi:hypothetical protein
MNSVAVGWTAGMVASCVAPLMHGRAAEHGTGSPGEWWHCQWYLPRYAGG